MEILSHGKTFLGKPKCAVIYPNFIFLFLFFRSNSPVLTLASAVPTLSAGPLLIFFSMNSISFFLFFCSTESHGKTRCVFTPPSMGTCNKLFEIVTSFYGYKTRPRLTVDINNKTFR